MLPENRSASPQIAATPSRYAASTGYGPHAVSDNPQELAHSMGTSPCRIGSGSPPRLARVPELPAVRHPAPYISEGRARPRPRPPSPMPVRMPVRDAGPRPGSASPAGTCAAASRPENDVTSRALAVNLRIMPPDSPPSRPHAQARELTAAQTPAAALWRIREYLRPYYGRLAFMIFAALLSVSAEIAIPLLTKSVVDSAIRHVNRTLLVELGFLAVALGLLQCFLNFFRRWVQAGAVAGMEKSLRQDLYAHLQRLDAGFHDAWQSGQLLSRATTDLSAIRRFGGFGVVFFITNIWTFLVVVEILIHLNWWLGLLTAAVFVPVFLLCMAFEKRYRVLSRQVQDKPGAMSTYIEEAASGIRMLKALGRRREAEARHREQADQ